MDTHEGTTHAYFIIGVFHLPDLLSRARQQAVEQTGSSTDLSSDFVHSEPRQWRDTRAFYRRSRNLTCHPKPYDMRRCFRVLTAKRREDEANLVFWRWAGHSLNLSVSAPLRLGYLQLTGYFQASEVEAGEARCVAHSGRASRPQRHGDAEENKLTPHRTLWPRIV